MSPPLGVCLYLLISTLHSCCASYVNISISPESVSIPAGTAYSDSAVTVTCEATADHDTLLALIPFNIINGTYIQHSCVGSAEFPQITQRFSTVPYYYKYASNEASFTTIIYLSPISPLDDGLEVGCCFYNLETKQYDFSETRAFNVSIFHIPTTSQPILPNEVSTDTSILTTAVSTATTRSESPTVSMETKTSETFFITSREFYITIGAFSIVLFILVALILLLIIVLLTRRKQQIYIVQPPPPPPALAPEEIDGVPVVHCGVKFDEL